MLFRFNDIIGNSVTTSLIQRSLKEGKLKNFLIYSGVHGTGKSSCAYATALALTCENLQEGEPCLACEVCQSNMKHLRETGISPYVVSKNLALVKDDKAMADLITEVFRLLKGTVGNQVYIFQEAHELSPGNQTKLLDEIDRIPENTYVILTTSRPQKLIPEIKSRTVPYNFNRLSYGELKLLFDRTVRRLGIRSLTPSVESIVIKYSRGIPRDLVRLIEFIKDSKPTEEELRQHLGYISASAFLDLLSNMKRSAKDYLTSLDYLLKNNPLESLIYQLKEFVLNAIFAMEAGISEDFNKDELAALASFYQESFMYKLALGLEKLDTYSTTEPDFRLFMLRQRMLLLGKREVDILTSNNKEAAVQKLDAEERFRENLDYSSNKSSDPKPLSAEYLSKFRKGN